MQSQQNTHKSRCRRKSFLNNFQKIPFRCYIFQEKFSWKNIFPQQPLLATRSVQSQQNTHKKQRCLRKKFFANNFQKILFRYYIFQENFSWKKNFPPAAPISHQERAKSAEYPIKAKMSEKKVFWNNFQKILFRCYIFQENFSWKNIFPQQPLLATRSVQSQQNTHKKQRVSAKKVLQTIFKKYFLDVIFFRKIFREKIFPPAAPISHQERAKSAEYPIKAKMSEKKSFSDNFWKIHFRCYIFQENFWLKKYFPPAAPISY